MYGNPDAPIQFIVAPTPHSKKHGVPFHGTALQTFNNALSINGLTTEDIFVCNEPTGTPLIRVPMDTTSLRKCTPYDDLENRRGSLYVRPDGRAVLPTIHPSKCISYTESYKSFLLNHDVGKVAQYLRDPDSIKPLDRTLRLQPRFNEVLQYIEECHLCPSVAFDIETSVTGKGDNVGAREMLMFSLAKSPTDCICVPLTHYDRTHLWSVTQETQILRALARLLEDPSVYIVMQNATFDMGFMFHRYGILTWPVHDTLVMSMLALPDFPQNLGFLTSLYARQPYFKDSGLDHIKDRLQKLDPTEADTLKARYEAYRPVQGWSDPYLQWLEFQEYSCLDSAVLHEIAPALAGELRDLGNEEAYEHAINALPLQLYMEGMGMAVNKEGLKVAARTVRKEINEYQKELDQQWRDFKADDPQWCAAVAALEAEIADKVAAAKEKGRKPMVKGKKEALRKLLTLNVKSPQQLASFFYDPPPVGQGFTKPKDKLTDEKAIKNLITKSAVGAYLVRTIAKLRNDLSKYWTATLDPDGRARCDFHPTTDNGRFSSKKSHFNTGFNFQNQPARMKEYLIADPGMVLINADLSQVQYRIVAWEAREKVLMDAFSSGSDIYKAVGARIFGYDSAEEVSAAKGSSPIGDGSRSERDWAKQVALATLFGMGPRLLARQLEIPYDEAKFLYDGIHRATPNIKGVYEKEIRKEIYETRTLTNCFGSKRLFLKPPEACIRDALAYKPQRTEQDLLVRRGMFPIWENRDGAYTRFQIHNQVHDSIVLQHPLVDAVDARDIVLGLRTLKESLERPFQIQGKDIVIPLDVEVGFNCLHMQEVDITTDHAEETLQWLRMAPR